MTIEKYEKQLGEFEAKSREAFIAVNTINVKYDQIKKMMDDLIAMHSTEKVDILKTELKQHDVAWTKSHQTLFDRLQSNSKRENEIGDKSASVMDIIDVVKASDFFGLVRNTRLTSTNFKKVAVELWLKENKNSEILELYKDGKTGSDSSKFDQAYTEIREMELKSE